MSAILGSKLKKGASFAELLPKLNGVPEAGKPLVVKVEDRAMPYLDHVVDGWVDGPPTSNVAWLLAGKDPSGDKWRRFTISKVGPWTYELEVFPTPFKNAIDPLSPGVPPSASRRG
jgi:hypothetical protein